MATRRWARVVAPLTAALAVLLPTAAFACPACYGASSERVLKAYWLTAAGLSLLPLLIIAVFAAWLRRAFRVEPSPPDPASETRWRRDP